MDDPNFNTKTKKRILLKIEERFSNFKIIIQSFIKFYKITYQNQPGILFGYRCVIFDN